MCRTRPRKRVHFQPNSSVLFRTRTRHLSTATAALERASGFDWLCPLSPNSLDRRCRRQHVSHLVRTNALRRTVGATLSIAYPFSVEAGAMDPHGIAQALVIFFGAASLLLYLIVLCLVVAASRHPRRRAGVRLALSAMLEPYLAHGGLAYPMRTFILLARPKRNWCARPIDA